MRHRAARVLLQALVIVGLIGVTSVIARPIKAEIDARMLALRAQAVEQIEQALGREIGYSTIAPSILRYVEIRGLTIYGRLGEPEQLINIDRLKVYYSLRALLQGDFEEAFTEVRIENTQFTFDERRDQDVIAFLTEITQAGAGGDFPERLVLSGRNLGASIRLGGAVVELSDLHFRSTVIGSSLDVEVGADLRVRALSQTAQITSATGSFVASGVVDLEEQSAIADVQVPQLSTNLASLAEQQFHVRYQNGVVEARKIHDRAPVDFFARIDLEPFRLYAGFLADSYAPASLVTLEGPYAQANRWLRYPVSGQASITASAEDVSYSGALFTSLVGAHPLPDGDVTLRFSGTPEAITLSDLDYRSEYGTVIFNGEIPFTTLRPSGTVELQGVSYGGIRPVWLSANIVSTQSSLRVTTRNVYYSGTYIGYLDATVNLGGAPTANLTVTFDRSGRKRIDLFAELSNEWEVLGGQATLANIQPAEVLELQDAVAHAVGLPAYLELVPSQIEIDAEASFDLRDGFAIDAPYVSVTDQTSPENYASFSLRYSRAVIRVDDLFAGYDGYEGIGRFTANLVEDQSIAFDGDLTVEDISYQFTGRYTPDQLLEISGLYDIDAVITFAERGEIAFDVNGKLPLPLQSSQESSVAFDVTGFYAGGNDWSVTINELLASGLPYYTIDAATVALAGTADPSGAEFASLSYEDQHSALSGTGSIEWNIAELEWDIQRLSVGGDFALQSQHGEEAYEVRFDYGDRSVDLIGQFVASPLDRLAVDVVQGALTGNAHVRGPVDALGVDARVELVDGVFDGEPLRAGATVALTPRSLRVTDTSIQYINTLVQEISAAVSLDSGKAQLSGAIVQRGGPAPDRITIDGQAEFHGDYQSLDELLDAPFAANIVLDNVDTQGLLPERWAFSGTRRGEEIAVSGGPEGSVTGVLRLDGSFALDVTRPVPIAFHADGRLVNGQLEADLTDVDADVPRLFELAGSPGVAFLSAETSGSVRVAGSIGDPDFYGTLQVSNVTGTVDIIDGAIGPARTFLVFEEKVATVRRTSAPIGPGVAQISAQFTMNRWIPEGFRIAVEIAEGNSIPILYDFGGVFVDGLARGSVVVEGDPGGTRISGNVVGSSTTITLSEIEEVPVTDDAGDLSVDVTVETGRGIEFVWPTSAFPILRGSTAPGETVQITHDSRSGDLTVRGVVDIQGGEVFYFDRSFYVRSGSIDFDETEAEFDPVLTVLAEIREVSNEGPVRITLVVDEDPLSLFTPRWESSPSMSETEILAMLGGNVFGREPGAQLDLEQVAMLTGDVVQQFGLVQNLESNVRDALQLDLFSLRTQVLGNFLAGAVEAGRDPLDTSIPSLGKYLDNTTLFLGKYLGTDLFLELLVQLRADDPLSATTQSLTGLSVESELSLEWQTPFFLLQWSLAPDNPESLFLTDNTVSFSWEYSY